MREWRAATLSLAFAALCFNGACTIDGRTYRGTFEKTLTVSGTVRLELQNGSGEVTITSGPAGAVRIRGEYLARPPFLTGLETRVRNLEENPPIAQSGSTIRIGFERQRLRNIRIKYVIETPPDTELRAETGSGEIHVSGISGRAHLRTGSGDVMASRIGAMTEVSTGSGDIHVSDIRGEARTSTGSGGIRMERITGDVRAGTGSGDIRIEGEGHISARTGSGGIQIDGATRDVRLDTGSGECEIRGNPQSGAFWEIETSSGDISIDVPSDASFRLLARSRSRIHTQLELTIEEQSKRELRARAGSGAARIEARASSGSVRIY